MARGLAVRFQSDPGLASRGLLVALYVGLAVLAQLYSKHLPPGLAFGVVVALFILLPGWQLSYWLFRDLSQNLLVRSATAIALGLAVVSIPGAIAMGLQLSPLVTGVLYLIATAGAVSLAPPSKILPTRLPKPDAPLWAYVALLASITAMLLFFAIDVGGRAANTDAASTAAEVRLVLDAEQMGPDPLGLWPPARYAFNGWIATNALFSLWTGIEPFDLFLQFWPYALLAVGWLPFFALAFSLRANTTFALTAATMQYLFFLSAMTDLPGGHPGLGVFLHRGQGFHFLTSLPVDKYIGWFFVGQITLVGVIWVLRKPTVRAFGAVALLAAGTLTIHPLSFTLAAILGGAFAAAYVVRYHRSAGVLVALLLLFAVLAATQLPVRQGYVEADASEAREITLEMHADQNSLIVLSARHGIVMTHPSMIFHPWMLASIAAAGFVLYIRRASPDRAVLYVTAGIGASLLLTMEPVGASLLGRVIQPNQLWRVFWSLPVGLVLVVAAVEFRRLVSMLSPNLRPQHGYLGIVAVGLLAAAIAAPSAHSLLASRFAWVPLSDTERRNYAQAREVMLPGSVFLAAPNDRINVFGPAFLDRSRGLTYRTGMCGELGPNALEDLGALYSLMPTTTHSADVAALASELRAMVEKYGASYIVVRRQQDASLLQNELGLDPVITNGGFWVFALDRASAPAVAISSHAAACKFPTVADPETAQEIQARTRSRMNQQWSEIVNRYVSVYGV